MIWSARLGSESTSASTPPPPVSAERPSERSEKKRNAEKTSRRRTTTKVASNAEDDRTVGSTNLNVVGWSNTDDYTVRVLVRAWVTNPDKVANSKGTGRRAFRGRRSRSSNSNGEVLGRSRSRPALKKVESTRDVRTSKIQSTKCVSKGGSRIGRRMA